MRALLQVFVLAAIVMLVATEIKDEEYLKKLLGIVQQKLNIVKKIVDSSSQKQRALEATKRTGQDQSPTTNTPAPDIERVSPKHSPLTTLPPAQGDSTRNPNMVESTLPSVTSEERKLEELLQQLVKDEEARVIGTGGTTPGTGRQGIYPVGSTAPPTVRAGDQSEFSGTTPSASDIDQEEKELTKLLENLILMDTEKVIGKRQGTSPASVEKSLTGHPLFPTTPPAVQISNQAPLSTTPSALEEEERQLTSLLEKILAKDSKPTRPPTVQTVNQDINPVTTPATIEEEEEKEEEKRLTELLETLIAEEKKGRSDNGVSTPTAGRPSTPPATTTNPTNNQDKKLLKALVGYQKEKEERRLDKDQNPGTPQATTPAEPPSTPSPATDGEGPDETITPEPTTPPPTVPPTAQSQDTTNKRMVVGLLKKLYELINKW